MASSSLRATLPNMATPRHKILFVTPGLRQGGAERQLLELIRRLPERFDPVLCLYEAESVHYREYLAPGEPRHVVGKHWRSPRGLARLARIIAEERPAILHSYRDRSNFWTRLAMQLYGVSVPILITSVRNRGIGPLNLLTESVFADFTDHVLSNSIGVREELRSWAHVPEAKLAVIHNFANLAQFRPPADGERTAARQRFDLAATDQAWVLPGRISLQKHQLGLLVALRNLRQAGRLPAHARFLLAGRERDRTYSRVVRALVERWQLAGQVRLLGSVSDVLSLYHAADLVVLPSLYEGMPNAVIEAQACALPVLVSRAANADGLVAPGTTGFEVPTADRHALAAALDEAFVCSPEELRAMGVRGRERVTRMLDNESLLGMFTALYDRLLAAKGL
jgi:glycosyltransferase involved in cell wall biosynthesis